MRALNVEILGDQDGIPERELKARLSELFAGNANIASAYLSRIRYPGDPDPVVALCIRGSGTQSEMADRVQEVFRQMFATDQSLDIMFVDHSFERRLRASCIPFYVSDRPPEGNL